MSGTTAPATAAGLRPLLEALGQLALERLDEALSRRSRLQVTQKRSAHDLVSDADRAIEEALCAEIGRLRPDAGFLGEENGWRDAAEREDLTFVVDPVDGTMNFVHGLGWACTSIGVLAGGGAVAGCIVDPYRRELFCVGGPGDHTTCNGAAVAVADGAGLAGAVVLVEVPSAVAPGVLAPVQEAVLAAGGSPRFMGSGALALACVASGRAHAVVHAGPSIWDVAAGVALVEGAGGIVLGHEGAYHLGARGPLIAGALEHCALLGAALARCDLSGVGMGGPA